VTPVDQKELKFMFGAFQRKDLIPEIYASDCEIYTPNGTYQGIEGAMSFCKNYELAYPDAQFHVNYIVADEQQAAAHYIFTATHVVKLEDSTFNWTLRIPSMVLTRFQTGRVKQQFFVWDNEGPRRQILLASIARKQMEKGDAERTSQIL
jgi:predicted ester cyclase